MSRGTSCCHGGKDDHGHSHRPTPCGIRARRGQAHDESKYPDFNGQWKRPPGTSNQFEPGRRRANTTAPLSQEYRAIFEANLKDQADGGQGTDPTITCIPDGMPRAMNVVLPME